MAHISCEIEDSQGNSKRIKSLVVCWVLLLSAVSSTWMLSRMTLRSHECFVSVTAREMLTSGDWLWPTCNGQPRLNKTPLSYWLVASLAKITGDVDEVTARLPSSVFAILSAAAILYFVSQWLSFRIAVFSTAVWATSLSYIRCSHSARPEMALAFFIILCFLSFYSAVSTQNRRRQVIYMLIFWISLGLGMLAKGPAPLPYVFIPLFFYVVINHKWKLVPKLLPIVGSIIFLAITLPWPLFIAHKMNWDLTLWKHEFFDRFFGSYEKGNQPIYYYLLIMFKYITPWFAFLPMAIAAPFYRVWKKKQPIMKFLWLWFVLDFIFLTINAGKRQHYILPLMPAIAILIGILLEDMVFVRKAHTDKFVRNVLRYHIAAIIITAIAGPVFIAIFIPQLLAGTIILSVITIAIILTITLMFIRKHRVTACITGFSGIVVWFMIFYGVFSEAMDTNRYSRAFSQKIARIVPGSDKLAAYGYVSNRTVQYFGRVIPSIEDKPVLYRYYEQGNWILATGKRSEELNKDGQFRSVFYGKKADSRNRENVPGTLFHKSAPIVKIDGSSGAVEKGPK